MTPSNKPSSNNEDDKKNAPRQTSDPNSRRQRLRAEQERAAREARVRRVITFGGLGVVAVAVIGLIIWGVIGATSAARQNAGDKISATYAVVIGKDTAPVTVDVFQDFMCPVCGEFEKTNSDDIAKLVAAGTVRLRIHPMNFLDDSSLGTKFSTRAANAFVTIWKAEPDKALAFNKLMYANQPKENSTGLTDDQIAQIAVQAGVSQSVVDTFTKQENADFPTNSTNEAFKGGVTATPTVFINGTQFSGNLFTAGALSAAIEQATKPA
jgi:protein-disulfide isomerase